MLLQVSGSQANLEKEAEGQPAKESELWSCIIYQIAKSGAPEGRHYQHVKWVFCTEATSNYMWGSRGCGTKADSDFSNQYQFSSQVTVPMTSRAQVQLCQGPIPGI